MCQAQPPAEGGSIAVIAHSLELDPQRKNTRTRFILPCQNQAQSRHQYFLRPCTLQQLHQFLNQLKIQAPIPSELLFLERQRKISAANPTPISSPAYPRIPSILTDKERVITLHRALKVLQCQLHRSIFNGFPCRCSMFREALYNIDSHLSEPTR